MGTQTSKSDKESASVPRVSNQLGGTGIPSQNIPLPVIDNKGNPMATLQVGGTIVRNQTEIDRVIQQQEGLNMSQNRRMELSDQWKFYLGCEPIQRGVDAGFVLGSITASIGYYFPKNRKPARVMTFWFGGFAVGMMGLPIATMVWHARNDERMRQRERELFARQRQEYHDNLKKGGAPPMTPPAGFYEGK